MRKLPAGLDLVDRLAEYVRMDAPLETPRGEERPATPLRMDWLRRMLWAAGFLAVAAITALAFTAYRQPELLLNLLGLRYCGSPFQSRFESE